MLVHFMQWNPILGLKQNNCMCIYLDKSQTTKGKTGCKRKHYVIVCLRNAAILYYLWIHRNAVRIKKEETAGKNHCHRDKVKGQRPEMARVSYSLLVRFYIFMKKIKTCIETVHIWNLYGMTFRWIPIYSNFDRIKILIFEKW